MTEDLFVYLGHLIMSHGIPFLIVYFVIQRHFKNKYVEMGVKRKIK